MTIRWTETAASDLENIYSFLAKDSQDSAVEVVSGIYAAIERLAKWPNLGKVAAGFPHGSRRLIKPPFIIFYRVLADDAIVIDAITHGNRKCYQCRLCLLWQRMLAPSADNRPMKIEADLINAAERESLDTLGYVVVENVLDANTLAEARTRVEYLYAIEGENAGSEFRQEPGSRRLANLVDKGELFERLIATPRILELVAHVLGPRFKLSSFNARSANPYSPDAQPLHCDAGALPDSAGYWVCNTIWLLDDFTLENGATRVIPESQNWRQLPQDILADPAAPHPQEVLLTAPAGSVVVMNTHAWHGGTANRSAHERRALHGFYCRFDKPQQQYQKRLLRPETQVRLSAQLRRLLALDDRLNDELSSAANNASGFLK